MPERTTVRFLQQFGRLYVLREVARKNKPRRVECMCECGNITEVDIPYLAAGRSKSCGCLKDELQRTHGATHTPEYRAWMDMKSRCLNPAKKSFRHYGGRGITICERWMSFENFIADMGQRPSPEHSIDRFPNPNGNYEPTNCRWATMTEQLRNTRRTVMVEYQGRNRPLVDVCEELRLNRQSIFARWYKGSRGADLFRPIRSKGRMTAAQLAVDAAILEDCKARGICACCGEKTHITPFCCEDCRLAWERQTARIEAEQ